VLKSYSSQSRAERLIAIGRVVLAAASLLAVWLDPTQPAKYAHIAYSLLAAYVVYSALVAAWVVRSESAPRFRQVVAQGFDLVFFSTFVYFTAGPSSPFIAYFVFSVVCGTLRWGWKGAIGTAAAALASFVGLGAYFAYVLRDPAFDLNPFVIHAVYLGVVAVLLAYLGAHEERSRREISQLSDWWRDEARDFEPLVRDLLERAQQVLQSAGAVLIWTEPEEPWLHLASLRHGDFEWSKLSPRILQPLVAGPLEGDAFLCADLRGNESTVLRGSGAGTSRWHGAPLHPELVSRLEIYGVVAAPLPCETLSGWLLIVDKQSMTWDDLEVGKIVAGIVASRLDLHYLLRRLRESAATEERIRLARDLHDGVMQSLTGIALRVAALPRQIADDPRQGLRSIDEIGRLIALEQQDLRFFIDELKPAPPGSGGEPRSLPDRLEDLRARVEQEWNLEVEFANVASCEAMPEPLARETYLIVREALVNAVRHGSASKVIVRTECSAAGRLVVEIADNGAGFPFQGAYSQDDLSARNLGPRSIRERVAGLRGTLRVESGASGSRLVVDLPAEVIRG